MNYIYPNEHEIYWSILIAVYPYITGLVAGAFIVASLERVFNVEAVKPTYRLALLTALAFLLVAPLPLIAHLGHPERAFEIMLTPHLSSAMAGFGFVYAWYLLVVLLLEIYYDYRRDIVVWSTHAGWKGRFYSLLTFGDRDISRDAVESDARIVGYITIIGLPSAVFLHGYVGFIFGSVKANPWWSSPLMPIIFLFSAMVSGIALVLLLYVVGVRLRGAKANLTCVRTLGEYLLYAYILDVSLELVEVAHVFYAGEEGVETISTLLFDKLFFSYIVVQMLLGAFVPMLLIVFGRKRERVLLPAYTIAAFLALIGVFAMRWNVVIGGQLLSKTLRGFTHYEVPLFGAESLALAIALMSLPFLILFLLVKILPPWEDVKDRVYDLE